MTTRTIEGLRELLDTRAETVAVSPTLAARTAHRALGVRRRRVTIGGVAAVAAVAAVVVPISVGWPGGDHRLDPSTIWTADPDDAWTLELPGLDLPVGEPLDATYAVGDYLVVGGNAVKMNQPVSALITVPDGAAVLSGQVAGAVASLATHLELVRPDGTITSIDDGVIAGLAATRQSDGSVLLVYGWLPNPTADSGEIRSRELGSDGPPASIEATPPATVLSLTGRIATIGSLAESGGYQASLDLDTGVETRIGPEGGTVVSEGVTAGGLTLIWDDDVQCMTAAGPQGDAWGICDASVIALSPDRTRVLTSDLVVWNAETGSGGFGLQLPSPNAHPTPDLQASFLGWESADSAVLAVFPRSQQDERGAAFGYDTYVAVRCSLSESVCERLPHPVDLAGDVVP